MSDWLPSEDFFKLLKENGAILHFTETTVTVEFPWFNFSYPRIDNYHHDEFQKIIGKIPPLAQLL